MRNMFMHQGHFTGTRLNICLPNWSLKINLTNQGLFYLKASFIFTTRCKKEQTIVLFYGNTSYPNGNEPRLNRRLHHQLQRKNT